MYTLVRDNNRVNAKRFSIFQRMYSEALDQFTHIIKVLNTGLIFQPGLLLCIRDYLVGYLDDEDQLLDYLYRLPPTNTQMTYTHCFNAGLLTYCFGKWCHVDSDVLDELTLAGFLYDCGLTKIDINLLNKPGPLDYKERLYVNQHVSFSYEMLKDHQMPKICKLILTHHERKDGSGYPLMLYGKHITSYTTLLILADQFEALTHIRSYRYALNPFSAIEFLELLGLEQYAMTTAKSVLFRIAASYLGQEVFLSNGSVGKIAKINKESIGRPVVYTSRGYIDLSKRHDINIIFV